MDGWHCDKRDSPLFRLLTIVVCCTVTVPSSAAARRPLSRRRAVARRVIMARISIRSVIACIALALLALSVAQPVDARNSFIRSHWRASSVPAAPSTMHRVNLALVQRNLPELRAFVARVSDPRHVSYGQYKSTEQIAELVAPTDSDIAELDALLREAGAIEVDVTQSRDFASVMLPVSAIQELFTAEDGSALELYAHRHAHSGRTLLRTRHGAAFKPRADLARFVQLVSGLSDFMDYPAERRAAKRAAADEFRRRSFRKNTAASGFGVASRRSKRSPVRLSKHEQSCVSSAPDFGRLKNSHEDVTVNVVIYCKNGEIRRK